MINKIIEYAVKNKAIILIITLILCGIGYKSLNEMPVDVYPNLNAPVVNVITENHGMAPEDIETLITFPLETSFNSLPYIKRVRSSSSLGISIINVEFEYGIDIYFARQLVSEKLQTVGNLLPENTEPPFIGPISSMFADAIEFTIKGDNLYETRDFAEWNLKPRLQTAQGVSNVINFGGLIKQFQVILDPNEMLTYGITPVQVVKALKENNINSSGGFIEKGPEENIIRSLGRIENIQDIENIVLSYNEGVPIYISNVADVNIGPYVRRGIAGENDREVVAVTVKNQYNSNVLNTIGNVQEVVKKVKEETKGKYNIETFYTQLNMILKSGENVSNSMLIGAILVIIILYVFLNNFRSTFIVALSIPLTLIISIIFLRLLDMSLNIMTLGGLAIGLGMIVDSSIIMGENLFRNVTENKDNFTYALLKGAKEVGRPIFFAILILISVFAPILTLQGIEGKFFIPLTFAVISVVLASLIISLTVTPVLSGLLYKNYKHKKKEPIFIKLLYSSYNYILNLALSKRIVTFIITGILFLSGLILSFNLGSEFMPEMDESSLVMDILLPPETSLTESARVASLVSQRVSELPEVQKVIRRTGRAKAAEHAEPVNRTESNVVLIPKEERDKSIDEIKSDIRASVDGIPGVSILMNAPMQHRINHMATGTRAAIAIKIFGSNLNNLIEIGEDVSALASDVEGVTDLRTEQIIGVPQINIKLDRENIARYGLNVNDVSEIIEISLNGKVATELLETQKRYDIFVRYNENYRNNLNKIKNLLIETPVGNRIPLRELAKIKETHGPGTIKRENALRRIMVQCNVADRDMGSVVNDLKEKIAEQDLPKGYFITFGGTYENQQRAVKQLSIVVVLTIVVVFTLLVISFKSFKNAVFIIVNIPLALAGGVLILTITGFTFSVPSIVGFIALIGIAVQDGIVLITHINNYRQRGLSIKEAVIKGGNTKLRPVLMTTFTTMLGLIPLAVRNVTGSEIQQPLAIVIIFGLLFSTALTLVVLPSLYLQFEK